MESKNFISLIARETGSSTKEAAAKIESLTTVLSSALSRLESVAIPSFGTFESSKEDERTITDLSTGRKLLMPPAITVSFVPASALSKKVAENNSKQ